MSLQEIRSGGVPQLDRAPESLRPELAADTLPRPTAADLRQLAAQGWMRFGIVAAVVDDHRRIMMLEHRPSSKTPAGALGPLAETAQLGRVDGKIAVETTEETLARAVSEELGQSPPTLQLRARKVGSWELNSWPVGINHGNQRAFGVCPVVHVTGDERERIEDEFAGTEEIRAVRFMTPEQIDGYHNVRPGTNLWLGTVAASPLMDLPPEESLWISLPPATPLPEAMDARLQEVSYE